MADVTSDFVNSTTTTACLTESARFYTNIMSYLINFSPEPAAEPYYDFVIVGGGTAGCVLASRLSEVPEWKVLLLEAGGEEPSAASVPAFAKLLWNSSLDWGYTTVPDNRSCGGRGCHWPRGRVLGGSSTINHMVYVRGNKADYDLWEDLGNPGWGYKDVLKYFKKWENNHDKNIDSSLHGTTGPLKVERMRYEDVNVLAMLQAFQELHYAEGDINGFRQDGTATRAQTFTFNGKRQSSYAAFLEPIRNARKNLKIVTNATVIKVVFNKGRAVAVEYTRENRSTVLTARVRKECIVSAGAVNSPLVLMRSGIGPRDLLESLGITVLKDLRVGFNLQDHVSTSGVRFMLNTTSQLRCTRRLTDLGEYYLTSRGPLAGIGLTEVIAFDNSSSIGFGNHTAPAIQYMFDGSISNSILDAPQPMLSCYYNEILVRTILMHPKSRGSVRLSSSDPYAKPLIYPNYFSEQEDVNVLVRAQQTATHLASTMALANFSYELNTKSLPGCEKYVFNSTSYWECVLRVYTQTIYHPVGTCKMGPLHDTEAVVDPELKVYGTANLRVIDASIMPTQITGNTQASVLMIAEKGAKIIKTKWKSYH
ncbi:glucose dehydrogenase [FAD, quinone]-like [Bacillus rossius redtenbacheri]|uniref:glucose dehydrogenase [FAD, quinone]-like n=1 Tax=Bacillus rossius redtenbacheri TaxID=93214 RepID=UPI002FDD01EA